MKMKAQAEKKNTLRYHDNKTAAIRIKIHVWG